jgi:hypothetical protein
MTWSWQRRTVLRTGAACALALRALACDRGFVDDADFEPFRDAGVPMRPLHSIKYDIFVELAALNTCTVVEDCVGVQIPGECGAAYINRNADRASLDALLDEWRRSVGEDGICAYFDGPHRFLSCLAGRCEVTVNPQDLVYREAQ